MPLDYAVSNATSGGPSFSLANRARRVLWNLSWILLASWTPAPLHRWRVLLLNIAGARVHRTAHVYGSARVWYPPYLRLDAHSCLGPQVKCYNMAPIELGVRAVVSQGAYLCAGTHDIDDPTHQLIAKEISIGEGAWVAAEAFIGPGVRIDSGAVIGARAVLFKDAVSLGVYAGNPAQLVRRRRVAKESESSRE